MVEKTSLYVSYQRQALAILIALIHVVCLSLNLWGWQICKSPACLCNACLRPLLMEIPSRFVQHLLNLQGEHPLVLDVMWRTGCNITEGNRMRPTVLLFINNSRSISSLIGLRQQHGVPSTQVLAWFFPARLVIFVSSRLCSRTYSMWQQRCIVPLKCAL